ncbi:hypothetical protein LSUE1_G007142 [Lachnellula suecica]|uniref:CRIB domain-containing protein n=1 Tax=Lachnellula suecica TaxID=602035 RepID=A0A8T9CCK5_9HELO|nr:hypothetical protein LSUE1_G007142 [Lachnellula suecica]
MFAVTTTGKNPYPSLFAITSSKKSPKKDFPPNVPAHEADSSAESLEPAIDGPPSPERIRAYTEQMKRSSIFGNNSRTNTLSSATSSFRSRESASTSTDDISLSRESSGRSNASTMPSESPLLFGSIFSRTGKKSKRHSNSASTGAIEGGSAREHYHRKGSSRRRAALHSSPQLTQEDPTRPPISAPFNFQHVTHTRQEHLPDLIRSSRMELVSEFSALRASQATTHGELKDIRTQDLHFNNFSSEALNTSSPEKVLNGSPNGHQQRAEFRNSMSPPQRPVPFARSHDNLKVAPPRPLRSPLSPTCPVALPTRTSSRTASVLFDTLDPQDTSRIERPQTAGGFQRPEPFGHPQPLVFEHRDRPVSHALSTPNDEAWPLTSSPSGNFGVELTDVQEEEEEIGSRLSRVSRTSSDLRACQSVPSLRLRSFEHVQEGGDTRTSTVLLQPLCAGEASLRKSPLSPGFRFDDNSWEQDIDYCYEHEIEADCDYQWDRCSMTEETVVAEGTSTDSQPQLELHLEDDDRSVYRGRFRPSLLVPSAYEVPELSPISNVSAVSSDPRTPSMFPRSNFIRSPSRGSSFKESHGFNLSPSLLIPTDFKSQMEQDPLYDDHFSSNHATSVGVFTDSYSHLVSPIDETSSNVSYRSSGFSRGSARSSSSTRISANSRSSQDSLMFLGRTANQAHRSIESASSLPDLIPGKLRVKQVSEENAAASNQSENVQASQHRRFKSLASEPGLRKGTNHFAPQPEAVDSTLSPVAESFIDNNIEAITQNQGQVHERKVSAPVISPSVKEFKGRARASTMTLAGTGGKKKGAYMLFPQN